MMTRWRGGLRTTALIIALATAAFILRTVAAIEVGLEVDEPINMAASLSIGMIGFPAVRGELFNPPIAYFAHPPFGFYLWEGWLLFTPQTVLAGRMLSVVCSVIAIVMLGAFVQLTISPRAAIITVLLLATDGWLVVTNGMAYLETAQLILVVAGVIAYWWAVNSDEQRLIRYVLAGVAIGAPFLFKHIGVYLIIGVGAHWFASRRHRAGHLALFATVALMTIAYMAAMYAVWDGAWWEPTLVQVRRTFGLRPSRGLNYNWLTAVKIIVDRYWLFAMTIGGLIGGATAAMVVYLRLVRNHYPMPGWFAHLFGRLGRGRSDRLLWVVNLADHVISTQPISTATAVIASWGMGAVIFGGGAALKSPHYFMLWLWPFWTLVAISLAKLSKTRYTLTISILVLALIFNGFTFYQRVLQPRGDALARAGAYITNELPADAIVGTEPYIAELFPQTYIRTDQTNLQALIQEDVDYLALYRSSTADVPGAIGGPTLARQYCEPLATFNGFKDTVNVCKIDKSALRQIVSQLPQQQP